MCMNKIQQPHSHCCKILHNTDEYMGRSKVILHSKRNHLIDFILLCFTSNYIIEVVVIKHIYNDIDIKTIKKI